MGIAADLVATLEGYGREELDAYGVRSHTRAAHAWANGAFLRSLVVPTDDEGNALLDRDEHVRPDTTVEQLAAMEPAFVEVGEQGMDRVALDRYPHLERIGHLHHRGNSPSLADGAGAVLVASEERARELGLPVRARVVSSANRSVDPVIMLTAGQEAVVAAVARAKMAITDVGRFEFAEAFAALCLRFLRHLSVDPDRFNVNGGTIAMGHAFGATGAILVATLLDEMESSDVEVGVVGISGAAGLGVGSVLQRV
jgi:acetyl-CoA C-acetyltransferase